MLSLLYRSKSNPEGRVPIYLRIPKDNQRVEIATGYFIQEKDWNARTYSIKTSAPKAKEINEYLQSTNNVLNSISM